MNTAARELPSCSVVLSSYNNFRKLGLVLAGYSVQTWPHFDIVVADDGSDPVQLQEFEAGLKHIGLTVTIVTQEDRGYRRAAAMNNGIRAASGDYIIMSDCDVVPRRDFVEMHLTLARQSRYIYGGSHVNIPESVHGKLNAEDIVRQHLFDLRWLEEQGCLTSKMKNRLRPRSAIGQSLWNLFSFRPNALVGNNGSAWKADLIKVNGFDESFVYYGSEDRELGVRLRNAGVYGRRYSYSLICVHLDHPKPHINDEERRRNKQKVRERRSLRMTWAPQGLKQ